MIAHLILTAFNIRVQDAPGLRLDWLEHRLELFERFCYPSVRGQSNQNFHWLVLLDCDTPAPFRRRIERLAAGFSRLKPVYTTLQDYRKPVLKFVDPSCTHLITTTLDNDDAIAKTFVERVQRQFDGQRFELVNLVEGYRLERGSGKLYRHRVRTNPFISLIEQNLDPITIRGCGPHNLIRQSYGEIRDVECEPLWLQVVHDRNIAATGVWGCRRVAPSALDTEFTIEHSERAQRPAWIALENVRRRAERRLIRIAGDERATRIRKALRSIRG